MKTLRLRAILKTLGYKKTVDLRTDILYEHINGNFAYYQLEKESYNYNLKYRSKAIAYNKLINYLTKSLDETKYLK
jgi:hypothetical protein